MLERIVQVPGISAGTQSASSGTLVFSNSNGLTFGMSNSSVITGSYTVPTVPAQLSVGNSNLGNTAGDTGVVTGRLVLVGSNNITLSGSTNGGNMTISFSGGAGGGGGSINFSAGTTSNNLDSVVFSNSNNVSFGLNGSTLTGSASFNQTSQSAIKGFGVSNTGQTAGNTGLSTGIDWVLAGSNSITLSQSTAAGGPNTVWVQHPAWITTQSGQAFSADVSSTFQTLTLQNSNGVSFSNNAGAVRITHDLQYTSNTSAITSNAVNTSSPRIQGIIGSNTTYTSGSVGLRDLNGITWQSTTGQSFQITHDLQYTSNTSNITSNALNTSASRVINVVAATNNTGGGTASLSSNVSFSAANGLTFYTSAGNAVVASYTVPTITSWTVSDSATSATVGRLAFTASNGLTLTLSTSNNGNHTVIGSYTVPSTAGLLSAVNLSAGTTSNNLSAFVLSNSNNVSFGLNGSTVTATATFAQTNQSAIKAFGVSNTGNTAGNTGVSTGIDWVIAGSNGITASQSTTAGGPNTVWISGVTTAAQSNQSLGIYNSSQTTGQSSSSTYDARSLSMVFSGNISGGWSNGSLLFNVTTAAQTVESQSIGASNLGNTSGTSGVASGGQVRYVIVASDGLIGSQSVNGASGTLSLINSWSTATTISQVSNANAIGANAGRFALEGHQHAGVAAIAAGSNTGNTSGNTATQFGSWVIAGSDNITIRGSTGAGGIHTAWISGATAAAAPVNFSAGTTSNNLGSVVFSNSNLVSFGLNGSTITGSVPNTSSLSATGWASISVNGNTISIGASTTANLYASSNTFGTSSGTADIRSVSIAGSGGVSVAASNSGWVIYGQTHQTLDQLSNFEWDAALSATSTFGLSTLFLCPFNFFNTIQWNQLAMIVSASLPATSCGNTISVSFGTSGQSQQMDHFHSFTGSNFYDFYLFSKGAGGSSTDLITVSSTRNSIVTFLNETWRFNATAGAASQTGSMSNSVSLAVSFPAITSATSTSVNAATTVTLWGPGYSSWASTASNSTTTSKTTGATMSVSIASTYPGTTAWSSHKMVQFNWAAGIVNPAHLWVGIVRGSSTSSSSSSASTSGAAGRSFTSSINMSDLTMTAQLSWGGRTGSIASSLGTLGGGAAASLAFDQGHGTFSATYVGTKTYMNNAGQANGEIALSDIATVVSFFKPWMQVNSNRI